MVSGDFNNDGKDDIATLYRNGIDKTAIHMFLSTGSGFSYQGSSGWWNSNGYEINNVVERVVAGDFDSDGEADIAAVYDNQNGSMNIHLWRSTGASLNYAGSSGWFSGQYNASKIDSRLISGDFDKDGVFDDVLSFNDFGSSPTGHGLRSHVWQGRYNETGIGSFLMLGDERGLPWFSQLFH